MSARLLLFFLGLLVGIACFAATHAGPPTIKTDAAKPVAPDYPKWSYKSNFGRIGLLSPSRAGVYFKLVGGQTAMEPRSEYYLVDKGHPTFQAMYDLLYGAAKERWETKAYTESRLSDNGYAIVNTLIVNFPAHD